MSDTVWISDIMSNGEIGEKTGIRTKYFDEEWEPAKHDKKARSESIYKNIKKHGKGFSLERAEMLEAAAVFDEKRFERIKDITAVGGFYIVKGKLAESLSQCDLGEGGLAPIPFYEADRITSLESEYFLLNFGARKNSFLPELSEDAKEFVVLKETGQQLWKVNYHNADGEVAVSTDALKGADIWFEEAIHNKIFMRGNVVDAIAEAGLIKEFRLKQCRIVEAQS